MTLEVLAERAGVTKSCLSKTERAALLLMACDDHTAPDTPHPHLP